MIAAGIVWLVGMVAMAAFLVHANRGAEVKFGGAEIIWGSVLWPIVVLVCAGFLIGVRVKRGRA